MTGIEIANTSTSNEQMILIDAKTGVMLYRIFGENYNDIAHIVFGYGEERTKYRYQNERGRRSMCIVFKNDADAQTYT